MLDPTQKSYFNFAPNETWTPSVNLYETGTTYLVCVDLAGVDKEKIDVEVVENRLKLRGARAVPSYDEGKVGSKTASAAAAEREQPRRVRVHLMEIDHGSFAREVELPVGIDRENIRASYRNGILWIEIPKV